MTANDYDEIDYWSVIKLDIIRKYASAYSKIMNKQDSIKRHLYIDAFAGAGKHISKKTGEFIPGSPMNALDVVPAFSEFHFIDLNGGRAARLRQMAGSRQDVIVYEGDCNSILIEKVFPRCKYEDFSRALCLLDPYALNVDWRILEMAGKMRTIEVFYNFMIMDANMNVFLHNPEDIAPKQAQRMDVVWGDGSWRSAVYQKRQDFFGEITEKSDNEDVAEAFRQRLKDVAGFKYVPRPIPMRNAKGAVIYYLFFASPNQAGGKIVGEIFNKYRRMGT